MLDVCLIFMAFRHYNYANSTSKALASTQKRLKPKTKKIDSHVVSKFSRDSTVDFLTIMKNMSFTQKTPELD